MKSPNCDTIEKFVLQIHVIKYLHQEKKLLWKKTLKSVRVWLEPTSLGNYLLCRSDLNFLPTSEIWQHHVNILFPPYFSGLLGSFSICFLCPVISLNNKASCAWNVSPFGSVKSRPSANFLFTPAFLKFAICTG